MPATQFLLLPLLLSAWSFADCIPFTEARNHIGETRCITGKVVRVKRGGGGATFFDFCEDFRVCPFTVVIFPGRMRDVGDVRQLQNRNVEIHGELKEYDGRAEIVLEHLRQLGGGAAEIPRLPKNYDVEQKGRFSAGKFRLPKPKHATTKKRQAPKLPMEIPEDGQEE